MNVKERIGLIVHQMASAMLWHVSLIRQSILSTRIHYHDRQWPMTLSLFLAEYLPIPFVPNGCAIS